MLKFITPMFYHEYPPPPALRPYIQCFWMLEHDYREPYHTHEHLWADVHSELIFTTGEHYYRKDTPGANSADTTTHRHKHTLPQNFLLGPQTKQLLLYSDGITGFIAARFHPWGFIAFSNQNATEYVDAVLPAAQTLKPDCNALTESLQNKSREEKLQSLTSYLLTHAPHQISPEHQKIKEIAESLQSQHGRQKITELANEFDTSPRMLERNFLQYIGMPAKLFARILRFNHAKNLIEQDPDIGLAALAYETGYTDQAHFSKNFKQFFDLSPARFKAKIKKFKADSADHDFDVVFVQD